MNFYNFTLSSVLGLDSFNVAEAPQNSLSLSGISEMI
jgi:hypothetical protein